MSKLAAEQGLNQRASCLRLAPGVERVKPFLVVMLALAMSMRALFQSFVRLDWERLPRRMRRAFLRTMQWKGTRLPAVAGAASDPYVTEARGVFIGTAGSTALTAGTPVYFDGIDWEKADATDNTKFAEAFAVNSVASGEKVALCTSCIIVDTDAPYTQGDQYFLSTTAGAITATRPTGANNLVQVLGFGLSTSELRAEVAMVRERTLNLENFIGDSATAWDADGDFAGRVLQDATNGKVGYQFMVPQNCVGIEIAYLWWTGTGVALDASDTYTIDASAGIDDETTTATTDGITAAALTVAANDLNRADVTAAFDGSGIIEAGNLVGVTVAKAAEGSAGDDPIMGNLVVVLLEV